MRDITHKQVTLRTARAAGIIFCSPATLELIRNDQLPKGNLFDVARAAGATVVGAGAIIDRSGGQQNLDVPFHALATVSLPTYQPSP